MAARKTDADIDRLYQLPLDEFTSARNALAKEAGADGAEIRRLQKPPLPAWAVNQLYWRDRDVYDQLIEAAEAVRRAHSAVLAGGQADLRATGKAHEQALEAALKSALGILEEAGHPASDATRHAVHTTLRSLPGPDPPGRLTGTLQPAGFEQLAGMPVRGRPQEKPRAAKAEAAPAAELSTKEEDREKPASVDPRALRRAKDAAAATSRTLKEAEHTARREEFEAARAARDAEKAARAVERAREAVAEAERALADAERDAAAAVKTRDSTEHASRHAADALEAARLKNDEAQADLRRLMSS
jgi:hypothetical protein